MTGRPDWDLACHRCGQVVCGCAERMKLGRPQDIAYRPTRVDVDPDITQRSALASAGERYEIVFDPFVEHRSCFWEGTKYSWAGGNAEHDPGDEDPSSVRWRTGR